MIKIAVCDDECNIRNELVRYIDEYFKTLNYHKMVNTYSSGIKLLESRIQFDIIFLDIDMPQLNGIQTAIELRKRDVNSKIVYVTNYGQYIKNVFKVHAFDFISKPITKERLHFVLEDIFYYINNSKSKKYQMFKTNDGMENILLEDILYFEYKPRMVVINSIDRKYISQYTLKEIYKKLEKLNFAYPHKSFIVNLLHVKLIKGFDVIMDDGTIIPLAQKRAVEFKNIFNEFLQSTFDLI